MRLATIIQPAPSFQPWVSAASGAQMRGGPRGLTLLAGLVAFGVSPALPALAATWSAPVPLPGSCGSSVAVNQAGAVAAGGTFQAAGGSTHVQLCTSPDGKTWQATDLGQGGSLYRPVMAVDPAGRAPRRPSAPISTSAAAHPCSASTVPAT
jgi:hypothetical protein